MSKKIRNRKVDRKRPGKPPRWLVFSALAASTTLGRLEPAQARETGNPMPGRLPELRALPVAVAGLDVGGHSASALRFDIPPGLLGTALDAFARSTGMRIEMADEAIRDLGTNGVKGLLTADQALRELLAGTGVTWRFTGARAVKLDFETVSDVIDVKASAVPLAASPKLTEPLRDTPQTITVISEEMIEQQGATTLRDVLRNVSGISIQAGEGGGGLPGDNLSIRGFSAINDMFIDGVRDFGAYSRDPYNVEQVEVAKGPASLYTGHGSTGGSVNLVTKTPHLESSRDATFGIGVSDFGRATADINEPLGSSLGGAAFRLNAMWDHDAEPGRDEVEHQRWGVTPSIAFGLGTPTRVTLTYSHLDQDNTPDYGIPWVPGTNAPLAEHANQPAPVDFGNFYGLTSRDYEKTVTGIATAVLDHELNDSLSLRSLVRQGRSKRDSIITAPRFLGNDSTDIRRELQSRDLVNDVVAQQNDLSAHFVTGRISHAFVAGTEVSRETGTNFSRTGPAAPAADLFHPNPDEPYAGPITRTGARTESAAKTAALYASDTVKLNEKWELTGGLRWDRFEVEYESVAVEGTVSSFERTDGMLSWRAGIVNKPLPNGSVYLSAGTSFNPSSEGTTGLSLTASTADLEPEESRGYELGTKWDFFESRLSLNAAAFQTEKTNAKTPGVNPGDPPTVLTGVQRIQGLELGASGRLTERWSMFFGYTWLDSKVLESNVPAERGSELTNAPEHSGSLWSTVRLPRGLEIGGGAQFIGDRLNSLSTRRVAPAYWLYDAMVSYNVNQRLTLRLNINNLADERYIDRVGGGHFIPGAGRSLSLTTSFDF